MDELRARLDEFNDGRRLMVDAFVDLLALAHRAGVDWDAQSEIQGRFFDGNVKVKRTFAPLVLLLEVWRPRKGGDAC